jgi:hypothetical protein
VDRDVRKLLHTKQANAPLDTAPPTPQVLQEGEERYCIVNGKARLYKKMQGLVWIWESGFGDYASSTEGVTNGNSHDHVGGDGAQIDHAQTSNLTTGDPHTQYIKHALATAVNDFPVASGAGSFIKRTLDETKMILGVTSARAQMFTFYS